MGPGRGVLLHPDALRALLERHHRQQGSGLLPLGDLPGLVPDLPVSGVPEVESIMASEFLKARQTRYGAFVALYLIVVVAIVIVANWLADHHNKTIDVTANKQFTLSDETKKVTGNLKKDVTVYYFDRSDSYDRARDLLDRYKNLSSHFVVEYVDPDKKPDVARVEGMHNYGDIIVDNGVKKETAKALTEEELTGALVRVEKSGE